ncbi:MAG: type II toxin-antitoxin system HipA family toxin [Burkholderiales bacterium]
MTSEAFVWIHLPGETSSTLAGRVRRERATGQDVGRFVYGKTYLANARALPIDPILLPLREEEFVTTTLSGHFSALLDAGPDSWGKRLAALEYGPQDELGFLLCTRGEQAGALSFSTESSSPPQAGECFEFSSINALNEAAMLVDQGAPLAERHLKLLQAGTGGARPKFSVVKDGALWLAKLESIHDQNLPANLPRLEAATLDLAAMVGIDVPPHQLYAIGARQLLLVKRFDRVRAENASNSKVSEAWLRRRYVSARSVFYSNPELQRWSYSGSYPRLSRDMARWSINPEHDRRQLFLRLVFNCLISNTDDHDLNHGLVGGDDAAAGFALSPAFDLVPEALGTARRQQALLIGDQGADARRSNILSAVGAYGLTLATGTELIDEVKAVVAKHWRACLERNGIGMAAIEKLQSSFVPAYFES